MSGERIIPSDAAKSSCTYTILSEGTAVSRTYHLLGLSIQKEINRIPTATLVFADGSPAKESFDISNKDDFKPGKKIEIKLGYKGVEKTVFKGIVIKQSIKIRESGSALIVECKNPVYKMTMTPRSRYFYDVKDSDAFEEIVGSYGLQIEVKATSFKNEQLVQYNTSDWDFMLCRTDVNGLICIAGDDKLEIKPPELSSSSVLDIQYGATIYDLDAEIDARLQFEEANTFAWFPADQEIKKADGAAPSFEEAGNISSADLASDVGSKKTELVHGVFLKEAEMQSWADAKFLKHRLAKIKGTVTTDGTAYVTPGNFIKINGIGERFSGKLFVSAVGHSLEDGKWLTTFQFGLNPEWFADQFKTTQPLAAALLPAVQGLHIGKVTALENDPQGENRIKVLVPSISNNDEGAWCRISTLDAGSNRGTFFLPEIDDEVVVGFINNDPRFGIVLGMLNSSAKPAPLEAKDANHQKGFTTRSGMKFHFDDDKKSILIDTPDGNSIFMAKNEGITIKDQYDNKIVMNSDGIAIESSKQLKIKTATDYKLDAGSNAEMKASSAMKISGQSQAELMASGTLKIQGSMVNIN